MKNENGCDNPDNRSDHNYPDYNFVCARIERLRRLSGLGD